MSVTLQGELPLTVAEAQRLWQETVVRRQYDDARDAVTVRCVSADEMQALNQRYRGKDQPTNVLTFSYPAGDEAAGLFAGQAGVPAGELMTEHDVAVCPVVAKAEAAERGATWRDYAALLLVHAFLHATGLDHEVSASVAKETAALERGILEQTGFTVDNL